MFSKHSCCLTKFLCISFAISVLFAPSEVSGDVACTSYFSAEQLAAARAAALERHNLYRCMHGAPPLVLDNEISNMAQTYTNKLATEEKKGHSNTKGFGENISWRSPTKNIEAAERMNAAVDSWYKEVDVYTGMSNWKDSGHFTAVIWKGTKSLGIGLAVRAASEADCKNTNVAKHSYVTANYKPPGNMQNEDTHKKNVEGKPSKTKEECTASTSSKKSSGGGTGGRTGDTGGGANSTGNGNKTTAANEAPTGKIASRDCYSIAILLFILFNYC